MENNMRQIDMATGEVIVELLISEIKRDGGTQPRAEIDPFVVDDYANDLREGAHFPAVTVFYDGTEYWLADGFHRVLATQKIGSAKINADVHQGTRRDAMLYSVGVNAIHGKRRTNADKRRAVETLLRDEEWQQWSDSEIARSCVVDPKTVAKYREQPNDMEIHVNNKRKYTTKNGNVGLRTVPKKRIYKGGTAYCKYCYSTHDEWDESYGHPAPAWECGRCGHVTADESMQNEAVPKSQIVYESAPASILDAIENNDISIAQAYKIVQALESAGVRTKAMIEEYALDDPELVKWLSEGERQKREWFEEIGKSGYIQPGEEYEAVHISAGLLALQGAVREREKVNRLIAQHSRMGTAAEEAGRLPVGQYPIIYADPPWQYEHVETYNRAIENHYPTMTLEAICALPILDMAADDALLFLWATNPKLAEAMRVIDAWGFEYRTNIAWVKPNIGMGYYARSQHELLLIARRGDFPVPLPAARPPSVFEAPTTEHSRKPALFYEVIESMYPDFRKVELFSRVERSGWTGWGADYGTGA